MNPQFFPGTGSPQGIVANWVIRCFGRVRLLDRQERAMRVLEEAIEFAQAESIPETKIAVLTGIIYARPVGMPAQEVGGIGVTLLAYCEAIGVDMGTQIDAEIARIISIEPDHFRRRQTAKAELGIAADPKP